MAEAKEPREIVANVKESGGEYISRKDGEQDDRIAQICSRMDLLEAKDGTLKLGDLAKFGSILGLLFALMTGVSSLWLDSNMNKHTEELRDSLEDHEADINLVKERVRTVRDRVKSGTSRTRELLSPVEKDLARIMAEITAVEENLDEVSSKIADTLDQQVLEQRFAATNLQIEAVQGQFDRIITQRLQPKIESLESDVTLLREREHNELLKELEIYRNGK